MKKSLKMVAVQLHLYLIHPKGVSLLIDSRALLSIIGSEMDYVESDIAAQFVFRNPNAKKSCGCGLSFMI